MNHISFSGLWNGLRLKTQEIADVYLVILTSHWRFQSPSNILTKWEFDSRLDSIEIKRFENTKDAIKFVLRGSMMCPSLFDRSHDLESITANECNKTSISTKKRSYLINVIRFKLKRNVINRLSVIKSRNIFFSLFCQPRNLRTVNRNTWTWYHL